MSVRRISRPAPPTGLRRLLFRAPVRLYRARLGWLLGGRFLLLTHTGRRSGQQRQAVLEVVGRPAGGGWLVASGFGHAAQWYRNISREPRVTVQVGRRVLPAVATPLPPEESGAQLAHYALRHPHLARRLMRVCGYAVDGSAEDYRTIGREHIPLVRIVPADRG